MNIYIYEHVYTYPQGEGEHIYVYMNKYIGICIYDIGFRCRRTGTSNSAHWNVFCGVGGIRNRGACVMKPGPCRARWFTNLLIFIVFPGCRWTSPGPDPIWTLRMRRARPTPSRPHSKSTISIQCLVKHRDLGCRHGT